MTSAFKRFAILLALALTIAGVAGCSLFKRAELSPFLLPDVNKDPGYVVTADGAVYKNEDATLTLRPVKAKESGIPLIDGLIDGGHVAFMFTMENTSEKKKIIFNPTHTALMDNRLGYRKPLDYTDFYSLAFAAESLDDLNKNVKGRFYDTNETVYPGQKVERLLIFRPMEPRATKATVVMKLFNIGSDSKELRFPFTFKVASKK
jgi:hypothetical protein